MLGRHSLAILILAVLSVMPLMSSRADPGHTTTLHAAAQNNDVAR